MEHARSSRWLIAVAIATALVMGTLGVARAQVIDPTQPNCVGQNVREVTQTYGGMAAATAAHNELHNTDLGVGEHLAFIRAMCANQFLR
jgi:hypothetical protein